MDTPISWQQTLDLWRKDIQFYRQRHPKAFLSHWFAKGLWVLAVQRVCSYYHSQRRAQTPWHTGLVLAAVASSLGVFFIAVACKCQLLGDTRLAGGVYLSNLGEIIFAPEYMGEGCVIAHQVTLGRDIATGGRPRLGNHVWIGEDCVIYGAITLGDGASVLPHTVLARSIPAGAVVQGNPARLLAKGVDNQTLRLHKNQSLHAFINRFALNSPHV